MKYIFWVCRLLPLFLISIFLNPASVFADVAQPSGGKYLNIATIDSRPLSNDKLLYSVFEKLNFRAVFTTTPMQTGYGLANDGTLDAVVASTPNIDQMYPNLRKIPVPLEQVYLYAFIRQDSNLKINSWSDLSGHKVGINTQRIFIKSQIPAGATIIEKDTVAQVAEGLSRGEYDVIILSKRANETLNLPNDIVQTKVLGELTDYLYLNKKYEHLIPMVTNEIDKIFADGRGGKILNDIPLLETNSKKTVLHIVSSNSEVPREEQFNAKLKEHFENDLSIEWYTVMLNCNRYSRDSSRQVYLAKLLRQDFVERNVAAIIVSADDAMDFLKDYYYLFFRNVPVLFYGTNEDYSLEFQDYKQYFTGISEQISAYETVSMGLKLFPNTKNLYVINDYTQEGLLYRETIEKQLSPLTNSLNIKYNENITYGLLLEQIKNLPKDSLIFVGSYFCDSNGQYFSMNEVKRLLERDASVPVLALYSTRVDYNSIGGKSLDYTKIGEIIAGMLEQILNGESAENIPAVTDPNSYSRWVFDKNMLDKLGIKEDSLPAGAQILNQIPSIWESDPRFAYTLVSVFIGSIIVAVGISIFGVRYRKQTELLAKDAKIKEVKERLERIISTSPVLYVMCIDDIVVEINEDMKNYTGLNIGDLVKTVYAEPEKREVFTERIRREGFIKNEVFKAKFSDGTIHRCLVNIALTDYEGKKAIVVWAVDIEQGEMQKDQLNIARQNLQTTMDTMPMPVSILDAESRKLVYGNNDFLKLIGLDSADAVYGLDVHKVMVPVQNDGTYATEVSKQVVDSSEPLVREIQLRTVIGKTVDVRIFTHPIEYNGQKAIVSIMTDLTAEKEYQRMLFSTAEKEKEANSLKSRFLVNMSHEIRTPMNAIIGLTEIELRKELPKETKEIYKKISISAKNLLDIINDILDLSKIEADKIELYEEEFELEDVLNSALLVASPRLDGKNVEFMLNASLDLPRFIVGDRTRTWQILKNFLDNSAKYTENGKIVLTVFADNKSSNAETVTITFIIEDTGIGISEEKIQNLFRPYEQVYNEAQKRYSGTGLGMTISKQLCELMGGKIRLESHLGVGTTIQLSIPFKRSQNDETEIQKVKSPALAGLSILAVDDDELSLDIMSRLLEGTDANCVLAKSGIEAMDIVLKRRDKGEFFNIILLDYMMEGLNGLETARQIHLALSKAPKLLMVTAYQKLLLKSELEENGIDDIIEKPFIPSQFIHKLCLTLGFEDEAFEKSAEVFMRFKDVHVLLCEDYHLNQEVATGMFAQFGITSTIAENGKQGVEILNSGKTFDIIFMDLQMPVMDGYEATQIIRANPKFDNIPIISLTADAMKEVVDKCLEIGMNDHVAKPIEFDSLNRVFQKWIPESKRMLGEVISDPTANQQNEALARFGGKVELYEKALLEFAKLLPEEWLEFEDAVQDKEKLGSYVHKLKGAAGNLSEKDIYGCAVEFEKSLRGPKPDKTLYERLVNACNIAKKRITVQMKNSASVPTETGTAEEFTIHLNNLKEALQNYNPKASSDIIKSLKEKAWPSADELKLQQLYELTRNYEFDAALDMLSSMEN